MSDLTEVELYFADLVLRVIENINQPMLMTQGEKAIVKKAILRLLGREEDEQNI